VIGGHELDVDLEAGARRGAAVVRPLLQNPAVRGGELIPGQPEVDEAGTGDLGTRDEVGGEPQLFQHALGGLPRVGALAPGKHHGEVGGEVAVARVARALEHELHPVGAEPRGDPRELGAKRVAHSEAAFPSRA
jgi:hypothetical protein